MRGNRPPMNGESSSNKYIYIIIAINIFFFIIGNKNMNFQFGLKSNVLSDMKIWTFVSYMFIHGDFFHLAFNMWSLNLFGKVVLPELKANKFFNLFFLSGIFGAVFWLFFNSSENVTSFLIGASGGVSGVMLAAAMIQPNMRILLLFFPQPIKLKTLMMVLAVYEIFSGMFPADNVAHSAHLGGFIVGYIYIKFVYDGILWDPLEFLFKKQPKSKVKMPKGWSMTSNPASDEVTQAELDTLLDKISGSGINSLTDTEMTKLKKAREQMQS